MSKNNHQNALPVGYDLLWYRIEKILGHGAFGITYLAHDINLERHVALKEYLPSQCCIRKSNQEVAPLSDEHSDEFKSGLERFLFEARTLTHFEHPNLIKVFNVFEANNTAYMVMNYEHGESLKSIHRRKKDFSEGELMSMLLPLMSGLLKIHTKGFVHRDIKPGNIFIRNDSTPVLLDFGSARQTVQTNPQTLTNFVSPGYAPIEQYASKSDKQGPWTDIYGLAATIYKLIIGVAPINAIDRSEAITHDDKDCYMPLTELAAEKYSKTFLAALDHALAFRAQDRPSNIQDWFKEFDIDDYELDTEPQTLDTGINSYSQVEAATDFIDISRSSTLTTRKADADQTTIPFDDETTLSASLLNSRRLFSKRIQLLGVFVLVFIGAGLVYYQTITSGPILSTVWERLDGQSNDLSIQNTDIDNNKGINTMDPEVVQSDEVNNTNNANITETDSVTVESGAGKTVAAPEVSGNASDEISELLTLAAENFNKLNLTRPVGNNAYDQYRKVLRLDANNKEAISGVRKIADTYISMAYSALDKDKTFEARRYINKAEEIWPESNKIEPARKALNNKLAEKYLRENPDRRTVQTDDSTEQDTSASSDSLIDRVREFFNAGNNNSRDAGNNDTEENKALESMTR